MRILQRLFQPAARLLAVYEGQVTRRPIVTQLTTGSAFVAIGDALAQHAIENIDRHDYTRTANLIFLRGIFHSYAIVMWYRFLHRHVAMQGATVYRRLYTQ